MGLRHLASSENVRGAVKKLLELARAHGIQLNGRPEELEAGDSGRLRKFRYSFRATSSYPQFVRFLDGLKRQRVPCAFEEFTLVAQTNERVTIDAQLLFTTLD